MNSAHIHLAFNHLPLAGALFSLLILSYALVRKSDDVLKTALLLFIASALLALPAFFTGEGAEETVEHLPGITEKAIHAHEEAAETAFGAIIFAGLVALGGLLAPRFTQMVSRSLLLIGLISFCLLGYASKLGGEIHHQEIAPGFIAPNGEGGGEEGEKESSTLQTFRIIG